MRIIGIDYGDSRIGLAISDPFGWTAQSLDTLDNKQGQKALYQKLEQLLKQHSCDTIVIGYPRNMNGTLGSRAEKTDAFIQMLLDKIPKLTIVRWDERLTSVAAHRVLKETGVKTKNNKGKVDAIAAVYILQGYLDSKQGK